MSKRTTVYFLLIIMLLVVPFVTGCGKKTDTGETQSITLAGSTSVQPLADELAEAYMRQHSGSKVFVQGGGSSAGIQAAHSGTAHIGTSSRPLKPGEEGLEIHPIAIDAIIIIVHPDNKVRDLTMEQIKKIYTGQITNWKEVGGEDVPIVLVTREEGSGTRGAFEEIILGKDVRMAKALVQPSSGAVRQTVIVLENSIGYISLGTLNNQVRALNVEGIVPSEENVKSGKYKISRPFLFLTKGQPTGMAEDFLKFVLGPKGQEIVGEEFISLN